MNIEDYIAGKYIDQIEYSSFSPEKINLQWIISNPEVNSLLSEANRFVGELNAFSQIMPDVDYFITMHILKEATTSSKIEGTKTNIDEAVINDQADIDPENRDDWREVQNYVEAINQSINELKELPVSSRLLKQTHEILLSGVRGKNKNPGQFRQSQNWIGATLKDAIFVPPHQSEIHDLMNDLEKFIHNEKIKVPHLIRIAIIHYQFETIHPFLDGNGRLGRLLITLYLVDKKVLIKPSLYLSDFFETNKAYYYDNLMSARISNNLSQWIKFFLVGVIETSKSSIQVFKDIIELNSNIETKILPQLGAKMKNGQLLLKLLYQGPITNVKNTAESLNISIATANRLLSKFVELGILKEHTGYKRNRKFIFKEYVDLFK